MKDFIEKNKKLILILTIFLLIIVGSTFGIYYYQINKVITVITMDINPSIAISLNKKDMVLRVESLNEDAKEIINNKDFKGKTLSNAISNISETLVEKGYITEEDNSILINVESKKEEKITVSLENKVTKFVTNTLKDKKIECNVIVQKITESSNKNAEKYGISNSKASYIEEILKENSNINFEDLKDKTISEINAVVEKQNSEQKNEQSNESKNEESNEQNNKQSNEQNNEQNNAAPVQTYNSSNKYWTTAPSINDPIEEWCKFDKSPHPESFSYNYEGMISLLDAESAFMNTLGLSNVLNRITEGTNDNRCTYCKAYLVKILTEEYKYSAIVDSVNKKIYDVKKEPVTLKITKEEAINILLEKFGVTLDDTNNAWAILQFTNDSSGDVYSYNTNLEMKDGTDHIATINAMTGEITWLVR